MKVTKGAVLFIDMLGFNALTSGELILGHEELYAWDIDLKEDEPHQQLAAKLLIDFRKVLKRINQKFSSVNVAQLSDCAFLWSADVDMLATVGRYLMQDAVSKGLLCRGGLATGSIHEPDKLDHALGAFIVGDAVTRAVKYENAGKGMRIFTDKETAEYILEKSTDEKFKQLLNPLNGETMRL